MISSYPAIFYEEENGQYTVVFPDLNYLATYGNDFNDAYDMAIECMAGHLYYLKYKENKPLPAPSNIKEINAKKYAESLDYSEYKNSIVNMISVDVDHYAKENFTKSIKKTVTIPKWLNKEAEGAGINFSKTLQEALIAKLNL